MSLAAAVSLIADVMDKKAIAIRDEDKRLQSWVSELLEGFATQLRIAVTASGEGESPNRNHRPGLPRDWEFDNPPSPIEDLDRRLREGPPQQQPSVRRALDRLGSQLQTEDKVGERMALCVDGGPADGDTVPLNPQMPEGGYVALAGGVYQLRKDGQVHYDEERTQRMKEQGA